MKYNEIIKVLKEENLLDLYEEKNIDIDYLSYDSRDIKENTLFFCKGFSFKEEYLDEAIDKGSLAYVSEKDYFKSISCILVSDINKAMSVIAKAFYPNNLTLLGVTGSKGKTTTVSFINDIMSEKENKKTGFISTIELWTGKRKIESHNTTPEGILLHRYLHEMDEENLKYGVVEVSSQAVLKDRIYGMKFYVGAFLNITLDHISPLEHKDFDDYFNCKVGFLKMCDNVVLCKHTDRFDEIVNELKDKNIITYGFTKDCDYYVKDIVLENNIQYFTVVYGETEENYAITMLGKFNVLNALCSIVVGKLSGATYDEIKRAIFKTKVIGRMQIYDGKCKVIVDYAHNKISAEALMKTIKTDYPNKNIKLVFGCPGDRGVNRRKDMAEISGSNASYIYLTAEDPQTKDVNDICDEIISYLKPYNKPYEVIVDREEAIKKAISDAKEDDIIAILGKGDETYQLVNYEYVPYKSDIKVVEECLSIVEEMN